MNDPIDYDSPLGISRREWTKVLGANLALLLLTYSIALVFTLCGSDFFLLNFHNDNLNAIEETLRGWGVFALVQIAFETIEATLIVSYVAKWKIKFWVPLAIYGAVPDSTDSFFKLAVAFLEDKDAPEGKAWKYWKAMK